MGTPEINNCTYNTDLGMRYFGRPTTFCNDLYVGGNLYVAGAISEGEPLPGPEPSGAGSCFDRLKITDGFRVEGDACFDKSIHLELDLRVGRNFAAETGKFLKNCNVAGDFCVGQDTYLSKSAQVQENLRVNGRFVVGEGRVDCEKLELEEAKVVLDGRVLATEDVQCKNVSTVENTFSYGSVSDKVWTNRIIVKGHVYRERTVEVMENGQPVTITVLVKDTELPPPEAPKSLRSCPVSTKCADTPVPAPPCPDISCG